MRGIDWNYINYNFELKNWIEIYLSIKLFKNSKFQGYKLIVIITCTLKFSVLLKSRVVTMPAKK